jgi:hypothetical protein
MGFTGGVTSGYGGAFIVPNRFKNLDLLRPNILMQYLCDEPNRILPVTEILPLTPNLRVQYREFVRGQLFQNTDPNRVRKVRQSR